MFCTPRRVKCAGEGKREGMALERQPGASLNLAAGCGDFGDTAEAGGVHEPVGGFPGWCD